MPFYRIPRIFFAHRMSRSYPSLTTPWAYFPGHYVNQMYLHLWGYALEDSEKKSATILLANAKDGGHLVKSILGQDDNYRLLAKADAILYDYKQRAVIPSFGEGLQPVQIGRVICILEGYLGGHFPPALEDTVNFIERELKIKREYSGLNLLPFVRQG